MFGFVFSLFPRQKATILGCSAGHRYLAAPRPRPGARVLLSQFLVAVEPRARCLGFCKSHFTFGTPEERCGVGTTQASNTVKSYRDKQRVAQSFRSWTCTAPSARGANRAGTSAHSPNQTQAEEIKNQHTSQQNPAHVPGPRAVSSENKVSHLIIKKRLCKTRRRRVTRMTDNVW